jgi:hypothetical protein
MPTTHPPALDIAVVVDKTTLTPNTGPDIATIAAALTNRGPPRHLARYPAFARTLEAANIQATSIPRIARTIATAAGRTIIPSAVDRELRLAAMREHHWQDSGYPQLTAAAAADPPAFHELGSRLLRMAAWQDIDLRKRAPPLSAFGDVQAHHQQLLDALGWTPPERVIPAATRALKDDPSRRTLALPPDGGIVIWEVEELIRMDRTLLAQLGADRTTVGVLLEHGSLRRPYAESHALQPVLEHAGTTCLQYSALTDDSAAPHRQTARDERPVAESGLSTQSLRVGDRGDIDGSGSQ